MSSNAASDFQAFFSRASGTVLERSVVAAIFMELNDDGLAPLLGEYSEGERQVFLMAYECFIFWVIIQNAKQYLPVEEMQSLINRAIEAFKAYGRHDPAIFARIWPYIEKQMPKAMKGGRTTKTPYPLPHIIICATLAGYPLRQIVSLSSGIHATTTMKRVADVIRSAVAAPS